ncbi:MAG TPA: hypothetical protein VIU61_01770 [Kofleriaceae bacterium]
MRVREILFAGLLTTSVASAQPRDPYGPAPVPAPNAPDPAPARSPDDPVLAEQIAGALVVRAQELFDAKLFLDAKQLAIEAQVKSPRGAAADQARFIIKAVNAKLGIVDEPKPAVELAPKPQPPKRDTVQPFPDDPNRPSRITTTVHTSLYFGLIGATIGSFIGDEPAGGAVPVGLATGLAAGVYLPRKLDGGSWTEGKVRTMGSASVWGGVIGGLAADLGKKNDTSARQVMVGASIGSTAGVVGGYVLGRQDRYTPGDIALVDTLAGIGAVGGLSIGMLMQPAESEAYSLNSIIGATAGVITGLVAGPQTNTTPRRMLRVAGAAAVGGAAPFLLYGLIYDSGSEGDERATGALSALGLVAGAYVGFRLTRDMDRGLDVMGTKKAPADDAVPPALLGRSASGAWSVGALAVQPLSPQLAPQPGMSVPLVGGAW